jgi:two-component system KDP operon response regulator KdpE
MAAKLLIVDDEPDLRKFLADAMLLEGYEVAVAQDARQGLQQVDQFGPDLILLDVMMPVIDGWEMLSRLRKFSDVPVIMLTAIGDTEYRVHGLDIGADDYLTKPFEVKELKARIRALLRRTAASATKESAPLSFDNGRLVLDPGSYRVVVDGDDVSLTRIEHQLLLYLARNAGSVMTYAQILENVWGPGYEDSPSYAKVYVRRLRQKIEVDPSQPRCIQTRWGVGYCLVNR